MSNSPADLMPKPERAVFCNRTLNMRSIKAVGFDMDYTLIHYDVKAWEARAYAHVQRRLVDRGLPVGELQFDADLFTRGLILDVRLGNIVKANRFGYVTQAAHGTRMLPHDEQRGVYSQVWVDLSDPRWVFLNTLFSLSESCIYGQLVDLLDRGVLPVGHDYRTLHELVGDSMNAAHLEGQLKAEIIGAPERFVDLDPQLVPTLLDLRHAGKKLFLATNSEWHYTMPMMSYVFDRWLGGATGVATWRDLFDLIVVQAKKPTFFEQPLPFVEVIDVGNERPAEGSLQNGVVYRGGNAEAVQRHFGLDGGEILYVGDHVYADVHVSSHIRRWRTALVLRELEDEVRAEHAFLPLQRELETLLHTKERIDHEQATLRLSLQRADHHAPPPAGLSINPQQAQERLRALRVHSEGLDQRIVPLARQSAQLAHPVWGPLMRAGGDKSRLARQIERHADVYTSRVSNFLQLTPFGYLRASRGNLPHDPPR